MHNSVPKCAYCGEEIVASTDARGRHTYVTASSVSQITTEWGKEEYVSIPLLQLSAIRYSRSEPVWCGLLAVVALAVSILLAVVSTRVGDIHSLLVAFAGGSGGVFVLLVILYFAGKTKTLELSSSSKRLRIDLADTSGENVRDVIMRLHQGIRRG